MKILGIDPGPEKSAYIAWNGETWVDAVIVENQVLRGVLLAGEYDIAGVEMVACMGMPVGKEVFETVLWIGRYLECFLNSQQSHVPGAAENFLKNAVTLVYRREIKMHFCNSMKAKDSNIRQAILDRFGGKEKAIGTKKNRGLLYGIKAHLWSALAIALYVQDKEFGVDEGSEKEAARMRLKAML